VSQIFGHQGGGFELLADRLHLDDRLYANPYELMSFYDNHDMARLDATDSGFIDADNWLFTARGIPVIYYGSEIGFERGTAEHAGNRNYFGQQRIDAAVGHPIRERLKRIATLRASTPALQRGLQLDALLEGNRAAFYRVYQHDGVHQIALVLLNKGDAPADFDVRELLQTGRWHAALGGVDIEVADGGTLAATVAPHDVAVYLLNAPVSDARLRAALDRAMANARRD
jgi:cyclomaltodextrin glucanotransferase